MNFKQIVWLAAVLHAAFANAQTVYRCDGNYQQQPCRAGQSQAAMSVKDQRSGAQMAQAQQQREQDLKAFQQMMRHRQHEIHEMRPARAVALSQAKTGDGPFDHGPVLSNAQPKALERAHRRKHLRVAKVPKAAPALQAATENR